ncbi:hypothetical protein E4U42_008009 [Claviceps africana]|uniref:DRPLA protein n=1 Tax=Claviceps africana TaxID=83212 RepID=A0A8K0NEE0_9HYPO|nr:hypothetical protein E4U42_008009 [Claviceps africana]
MPPQGTDQPVKKQSKWSPEEDALIIELRGSGMKWEDVSKRLPGRSSISCRLHYQNYLERRSEWDEERKNKLARLYERFKSEMWAKVAEELAVPWRAAEAMHWLLGEHDMAKRAGVVPFSLAAVNHEGGQRATPAPRAMYASSRVENARRSPPRAAPSKVPPSEYAGGGFYTAGLGGEDLAPIKYRGESRNPGASPRNPGMLPSLAELTTGVSPYPFNSNEGCGQYEPHMTPARVKRRGSLELVQDRNRRRRLG